MQFKLHISTSQALLAKIIEILSSLPILLLQSILQHIYLLKRFKKKLIQNIMFKNYDLYFKEYESSNVLTVYQVPHLILTK